MYKMNKLMKTEKSPNIEKVHIKMLNNDCLVHIFKYLNIREKLIVEDVCKSWRKASKSSWSNIKSLDVCKNEFFDNFSLSQNTQFLIEIIKRCGPHLNKMSITIGLDLDFIRLFSELSKFCKNLQDLSLTNQIYAKSFTDDELNLLFKSDLKFRSIYLYGLSINGSCLSNLQTDSVEELSILSCIFRSEIYFENFLSQLTNLKKIVMSHCNDTFYPNSIESLYLSDCENITEFYIRDCASSKYLSALLSRQKKLTKLSINLKNPIILKDVLDSLQIHSIQEIWSVNLDQNLSYPFFKFQNLTVLSFFIKELTDQCVQEITECNNMKKLKIEFKIYSLTPIGEKHFKRLSNLEYLDMNGNYNYINIDTALISISKCKKLNYLSIFGCNSSNNGFLNICLLNNLINVDLSFTGVTNELLIVLVNRSVNLKDLKIISCANVNTDFINHADLIKYERRDSHFLEIHCFMTNINRFLLKNVSLLLKVKYYS